MSLKKSIFGSKSERRLYYHLKTLWEEYFNIWHNIPFANVFDIDTLDIDDRQRDFLLKTSIDYTICDKKDMPLMCIEYDGMSCGYSRDGEYVQIKEDPKRKRKLELKLKIASQDNFPFYIISFPEKMYLLEKIHLTVTDGIIGQTIAKSNFYEKIKEYLENERETLASFNEWERHEYIQDMVISTEVELEMEWDPIVKKTAEIGELLHNKGIATGFSLMPLSKPELPEIKDFFDMEGLKNRLKVWKDIKWHGCEVTCETPKGQVTQQAWVRNFEGFASPIIIVNNIAQLLAYYKAATMNGIEIKAD